MIDEKKLGELRKAYADRKETWPYVGNLLECMDTLEALWKENAELKAKLKHYGGWSGLGPRINKLEAVARAAEEFLLACNELGYGRTGTPRDKALISLDKALAALKEP